MLIGTQDGVTWQYDYDGNGSLIESTPAGGNLTGASRYTYNIAGFLVAVENHDGTDWQDQAQMVYDGLGDRLSMTAWAGGESATTQYELEGGRVLTAIAGDLTTTYLYGMGPVAELTDAWAYSLPDGTNTQRQLTDTAGEVSLMSSYTPWGDTLTSYGSGSFSYGYFGGVMDNATGLLYVGNGQYYDPATGRFLNRNARPDQGNPYVPWKSDPTGALFAPLGLLALMFSRRKKNSRWDALVLIMVLSLMVGISLSACQVTVPTLNSPGVAIVTITPSPTPTPTPTYVVTITAIMPKSTGTPVSGIWYCVVKATKTATITGIPQPDYTNLDELKLFLKNFPIHINAPIINQHSVDINDTRYSKEDIKNHACGPTALLMALKYAGIVDQSYKLEDIITLAMDPDPNNPDHHYFIPDDELGYYTIPGNMVNLAQLYTNGFESGNAPDNQYSALDFLITQLSQDRPVITDVTYKIPDSGINSDAHYVLVTGLYATGEDEDITIWINYNNPWLGTREYASFDNFNISWFGNVDPNGQGWYMYIGC